jgi:diguanylate cyclase (GGDEF)-like protein
MGRRARFRDVLAVREFRALWAAELLSVAGDQLARVALAVLVYRQTSSAGWTALTYALTFMPALLGGVFLSGLADRYPRRELMVGADLVRAALAGLMALPALPLPLLLVLVFTLTLVGSPFKAAHGALLPLILDDGRYRAGLALRAVTSQGAQLVAFLGGAALLVTVDPHAALGLNAGTFVVAAVVVAIGVRHRPAARESAEQNGHDRSALGTARLIWCDRRLRGLIALSWLIGVFTVPEGLAAPYAASIGVTVAAAGILMAADPLGSIVGAWLHSRTPEGSRSVLTVPLAMGSGLPLIACIFQPGLAAVVVLWAVSGACSTVYFLLAQESFVLRIPDHHRGAANGLAGAGVLSSQGVAILAGGLVADATSPALAIAASGALGAVLAGMVGASWLRSRPHREREADAAVADDEVTTPCSASSSTPPLEGAAAEHGMRGANPAIIARPTPPALFVAEQRSMAPWRWVLWQQPKWVLLFILVVELITLGLSVLIGLQGRVGSAALATFGVIVGLGVAMGELSRNVERQRRRFNDTPHVNLTSVWTFSAAILLPPPLTAMVVIVLYQHLYWRSRERLRGVHAYRLVFSASTVILAAYTAWIIRDRFMPIELSQWNHLAAVGTIMVAIVVYSAVNSGLVAIAITLTERRIDIRRSLGTGRENALEYGTLGLGAATALLITLHPAWAVVMIPALLVLHRSVLTRQLEEAAATDSKTGLTNAITWTSRAEAELRNAIRNKSRWGVLMIDLDHFKSINDTYNHLVGDRVLQAVADALVSGVGSDDEVGRYGGEEFVVSCPEVGSVDELVQIGSRLCELIRGLRIPVSGSADSEIIDSLTVSVGVASYPEFGPELHEVLVAADDALFVAKDNGRNQVQSIVAAVEGLGGDQTATTGR